VKRLKRLFSNYQTSEMIQGHGKSLKSRSAIVTSIHQSQAWQEWYSKNGIFKEHRSISFGFCTDGLNPYSHEKTQYSMWPLFLIPLNFPHTIRVKSGSMFLTGTIPGPKEPQNMDPYLDILVDDILDLQNTLVFDAYQTEDFQLKGNIVLHILDYPGQNKVFKHQGSYIARIFTIFV